ncbi:hypothetical protein BC629DRAFT_1437126 [Irpex lacteus]|nr:hypothetical protein BC629DRAFT_1437126 [Irpex lacteus]
MGLPTSELLIDLVDATEVAKAHAIEIASFPPSEADSFARYEYRIRRAPELFLGAFITKPQGRRTLVGVVCATAASSEHLTLRSMDEHIPSGTTVCIHAVCVLPAHRNKGIAISLLKEYIARLGRARRDGARYERVVLITHKHLIGFYEKAGFEWAGKSDVVLGPEQWYEMCIRLHNMKPPTVPAISLPAAGSESRPRNVVPKRGSAPIHAFYIEGNYGGISIDGSNPPKSRNRFTHSTSSVAPGSPLPIVTAN